MIQHKIIFIREMIQRTVFCCNFVFCSRVPVCHPTIPKLFLFCVKKFVPEQIWAFAAGNKKGAKIRSINHSSPINGPTTPPTRHLLVHCATEMMCCIVFFRSYIPSPKRFSNLIACSISIIVTSHWEESETYGTENRENEMNERSKKSFHSQARQTKWIS